FTAEYGNDFDGIEQIGGRYLIEGSHRFGVDTEFHSWLEELPQGTDSLWTGDFNVVHRFAQSEHVQFRTGLGANWLEDHGSADFGINFTYGVDVFPKKPWVWSNTIDLGTLGDAGRFHFRSTIGLQVRNVEFFTGYDYQRIGDAELPGLLTGIKLSF
ncbi:MAG: hypothetical protein KDA80_11975, partial [Planctomycetaceae bacterium]|nr:hypothetical protein [Planctomycetaceae bacterium]